MNLASLLEHWGESHVLVVGGAIIGLIFGFMAQRTRFCARAAVIECCEGRAGKRLSVWLLAFGACLVSVQALVSMGWLKPEVTRFMAQPGSISGAVLGGLCFGAGMVLTRGCASRLLILSANGNLRALLSGLVFAVTVQASIGGWLAPLKSSLTQLWAIDAGPSRNLLQLTGMGAFGGMALSLLVLGVGVFLFLKHHRGRWALGLGSAMTGTTIALGWGFTQAVAANSFEAVAVQSLSFSAPSAEWLMRTLSSQSAPSWGFDTGVLPGTFAGSLLGAMLGRDFKFEGFKTENKLGHYLSGAVLMGFGAVLAGGCTVGAGMTGGAIFALTAWLTLISIWLGAGLAWRISQRMAWAV